MCTINANEHSSSATLRNASNILVSLEIAVFWFTMLAVECPGFARLIHSLD